MNSFFKSGPVRSALLFLGSLKLAMALLAVVILACAVGTVVESRLDTAVAQAYVYDAPWFIAWLSLLCINLTCAVIVLGPMKSQPAGFIITHAGVVILLLGAIVGRIWGVEGFVILFKGEAPIDHLTLYEKLIEVVHQGESRMRVIHTNLHPPDARRPLVLQLKNIKVSVLGYAERLGRRTLVEEDRKEGSPALHLVMRSATAAHPIEEWLVLNDAKRAQLNMGSFTIRLVPETRAAGARGSGSSPGSPPGKTGAGARKAGGETSREMHFVFAKMPDMAVARSITGPPTGIRAIYRVSPGAARNEREGARLELDADGRRFELAVDQQFDRDVPLKGTPWTVRILKTFADFRMKDKEPVSISNEPNNPALMFEVTGHPTGNRLPSTPHGKTLPHGHPAPDGPVPSDGNCQAPNRLLIYYAPGGGLSYQTQSKSGKVARGVLRVGKEFPTGWGDWKLVIDREYKQARLREELAPVDEGTLPPFESEGLQVRVEDGKQSATQWIALGEPADFSVGGETIPVAFGHRLHPLGVGVALDDFEVERAEGTLNPAGFKSHVRFIDPASKAEVRRAIWMNHPADFPDFPGVGLLGTAYKFSQASWNPDDLNQTTLQVIRDPGWSLKWIGSLMICVGLFTMFYLRPYSRRRQEEAAPNN